MNAGLPGAEIVCVGTELLSGKPNTHAAWLSLRLREAGFRVLRETTCPDDPVELRDALARAAGRAQAVLVCGGLGPTFDDLTREAASAALGRPLAYRPALYAAIRRRYRPYRLRLPAENRRQAFVLRGARVLPNARGSAPGQLLFHKGCAVALLPGPFVEMEPMFLGAVLPALRRRFLSRHAARKALFRFGGLSESAADERLKPVLRACPQVEFTILAGAGLVELHASASARTGRAAERALARVKALVERRMRGHLCGSDGRSLEAALGGKLLRRGWRLAAAESCTGGLLSKRLTDVPGASRWFLGSVVAYDNGLKRSLLGVSARTLARSGAVSAACARAMAAGARERLGADAAVSITGVAGPEGGTRAKPVGTAYIGLALPGKTWAFRRVSPGTRQQVRERSVTAALWRLFASI